MSTTEVRIELQAGYARRVLAESRPSLDDRLALLALPVIPDDDADREALQIAVGSAVVALRAAFVRLHNCAPELRHYPSNILQALAENGDRIRRLSLIEAEMRVIQDHLAGEG